MANFKTVQLRPMTGLFDTLSSADEIGYGNWRLALNATTRSTRNRQVAGGWRRLFADDAIYNNQDLHDQLVDRQVYYDAYSAAVVTGGGLVGYTSAYQAPPYVLGGEFFFPPAENFYAPVYVGDYYPTLVYNGCRIFYPHVGYPYDYDVVGVDTTGIEAHWRFDGLSGGLVQDEVNNHDLAPFGGTFGPGLIGNEIRLTTPSGYLLNADVEFFMGDIKFGMTGWVKPTALLGATEVICGRWSSAGTREYRLVITTGGQLRFDVSSDGTAIASVTHPHALVLNTRVFFACWHDPVLNTINIKVNLEAAASAGHAGGVFAGGIAIYFAVGYDEATANATLNAALDSVSVFKNAFPDDANLVALYNGGAGLDYPFSGSWPNTGDPWHYLHSYIYTSCEDQNPAWAYPGYPYGPVTPQYSPIMGYSYEYCGTMPHFLSGCREAVTMLQEIVVASGRKLIASTMSRVYELNQSAGSWRILADGLGNSGYTVAQCTCNGVRGVSATLGGYLFYTNGFDAPRSYFVGDAQSGCTLQGLQPIVDLLAINVTQAGGVVVYKGFVMFFDITADGERQGGTVLWGDIDSPDSFIESDTSFAGQQTVVVGETILAAAPLGNALMLYTDKSIIRCTLVGGEDVFNFETIYTGGNAMKYKFSLVNAGDQHLYVGESDIFILTQFDARPVNLGWITKAAGMMFLGIGEDHAAYEPLNRAACNMVTGGWNDEAREAFISYPTGDNVCPNVTLRFNMKFGAADLIDHGFTAFLTFRKDDRPTIGQWLEDLGVCARGTMVATGPKDGPVCPDTAGAVSNPPLYIWNETENPNADIHPRSLCALLRGKTLADFCPDCAPATTFIAASAEDFALKQIEDDVYYREMLGGSPVNYTSQACHGEYYHRVGYDVVMQQGAENFRTDDEKMVKMIGLEAEPLPQSPASTLSMEIGYAATPNCFTWKPTKSFAFECQSAKSAGQHATQKTRPDGTFYFPTWRAGRYLSARFIINVTGGGGTFSAMQFAVRNWGQAESP